MKYLFLILIASSALAKPGDSFQTSDQAAYDALKYLRENLDYQGGPYSVNRQEWGGLIYKTTDGFKAQIPYHNNEYMAISYKLQNIPQSAIVGTYHTHPTNVGPGFSAGYGNVGDRVIALKTGWISYLMDSHKQFIKFDPLSQKVSDLTFK